MYNENLGPLWTILLFTTLQNFNKDDYIENKY